MTTTFRKLPITGLNKMKGLIRTLTAVTVALLLMSFPFSAAAEEPVYGLSVSGFVLAFDVDTDYYLCKPADFKACSIDSFTGFTDITVSVEQYGSHLPYTAVPYELGKPLELGNGRAKVTVTATLPDKTTRSYLIALTDPNAADYSYAWVRTSGGSVNLRAAASMDGAVLTKIKNNSRVYYLGTEGDWCKIQLRNSATEGYVHKDYLQVAWDIIEMPERYKTAVEALQAAHPNWVFRFVDVQMTYAGALEKYGAEREQYIDPLNYLAEDKIFAMLDIDSYDPTLWSNEAIAAVWANETYISKADATVYFNYASESIMMNPVYIACRAALESGYGGSKFARGLVPNYEGYYNFFGIQCVDANPEKGAAYAKARNWNTVFRSIVEGANWVKDQYLDQGAITPYFFRYAGLQNKVYMTDALAPQKEASILKRAYTDPNAKAEFIIPVYGNMPGEGQPQPEVDLSVYTDLNPKSWYYEEVAGAIKAGLFQGQSTTYFNVNGKITRAEFVTALARLCGADVTPYKAPEALTDVKPGKWYYEEIGWAYAVGVTEGRSPTSFAPEDPITRQEMCKMLAGTMEKVLGVTLNTEGAVTFADQASIAPWATEWVAKCSSNGLFKGDDFGNFNPKENATRAQAAIVFYRCHSNLKQAEAQNASATTPEDSLEKPAVQE